MSETNKEKAKSLHDALSYIQVHLVSKKENHASVGNYNYRKAEDIMADVKPFLDKFGCFISFNDSYDYNETKEVPLFEKDGSRLFKGSYIYHSRVTISNGTESISADGFAEVAPKLAAMSPGQIWGATMSYARKYALSALFLIDNEDDLDVVTSKETKEEMIARAKADFEKIKDNAGLVKWATDFADVMGDAELRQMGAKKKEELKKG